MKYKIIKIINESKKSERTGKRWISCRMLINHEGKEVWASGFGNHVTHNLQEGQEIDLTLSNKEYNGKTYLNFADLRGESMPSFGNQLAEINARIDFLFKHLNVPYKKDYTKSDMTPKQQELENKIEMGVSPDFPPAEQVAETKSDADEAPF